MLDVERLWRTIPVGEDNAAGATEIWMGYDLGARSTLHFQLNRLTAEGRSRRKTAPYRTAAKCICIIGQRSNGRLPGACASQRVGGKERTLGDIGCLGGDQRHV
jgi:hypothetical protein